MTNINEPPAVGPQRNAALAELLGWTFYGSKHEPSVGWYSPAEPEKASVWNREPPNYCGNDADCFRLLAELNARKIRVEILTTAVTVWLTCKNSPHYHCAVVDIDNSLPDKREALRDAITAAAWKARQAQKESEDGK